jgi:8-oxo-dGTP pyrophosphatase MutT (NUDIX family)
MKKVIRAMLVPYQKHENVLYFLCMRPSDSKYGGPSYQLCKGRIDDGETSYEAAIREGEEELGIDRTELKNIEFVATVMDKTCHLYVAELPINNKFNKLQFETVHVAWLTHAEFQKIGRDWQRKILDKVIKHLD